MLILFNGFQGRIIDLNNSHSEQAIITLVFSIFGYNRMYICFYR